MTSDITEEEIWEVIKSSPKEKSPGSDGSMTEFYLEFWQYLKEHLLGAYIESLKNKELTMTQRQGVITLIPKPRKDLDLLK